MLATRRRRLVLASLTAALLIAACHWPALSIPFFGDDYGMALVLEDGKPAPGRVLDAFVSPWGGLPGLGYYRPLHSASCAVDFLFYGAKPFFFHFHNLLLHLLAALLVVAILRTLAPRAAGWRLAGAGLFFGVHPITAELTAGVVSRMTLQAGVCYLLSLLAVLRFRRSRRSRWLAVALGSFVLGMGCKESIVTLPAVILVALLASSPRDGGRRLREQLLPAILFVLGAVAYVAWRRFVLGPSGIEAYLQATWASPEMAWTAITNVAAGIKAVLLPPVPEVFGRTYVAALAGAAILAMLHLFAGRGLRRCMDGPRLIAATLLLVPLFLVAGFPILRQSDSLVAVSRLLYLSLAGGAILLFLPPRQNAREDLLSRVLPVASVLLVVGAAWTLQGLFPVWRQFGLRSERIANALCADARRQPDRPVAFAAFDTIEAIPDPGVWLLFATQPPFSSIQLDHTYPLPRSALRRTASLIGALEEAGAEVRWWNKEHGRFEANPPRDSSWAVHDRTRETQPLAVTFSAGGEVLRPVMGWTVRFNDPPARVRLVFVTPAMPFVVEACPDSSGVVKLSDKQLRLLTWLVAIRRTARVLFYAESSPDATRPDSPVRRTRPLWISVSQ